MNTSSTASERAGAPRQTARSLRVRLALGFGLMVALLTGAMILMIGELATGLARKQIGHHLTRLAIEMRDKLDVGMFERLSEIELLANLDATLHGPRNPALRQAMLEELGRTAPDYSWLGYMDRKGRVQVSLNGLLAGEDVSGRPWFRDAQSALYVGDVREATLLPPLSSGGREIPRLVVDIALPLRDREGSYGVVAGRVSWTWAARLREAIESYAQADSPFEMLVVSARREVLLGPQGLVGTTLELAELSPAQLRAYDARLERWPDGVDYLIGTSATRGHATFPGLGWIVIVRQRADLAFAPVRLLQQRIALAGLLLALAAIALGWWLASRVSRPLFRISAAADEISRGHRRVAIPSGGGYAETDRLSISLRAMLTSLNAQEEDLRLAQERLEGRVRERTAELAKARAEVELEAAEHALASDEADAARQQLALALESSHLATWDYDVASGRVLLSGTWAQMTGAGNQPVSTSIDALFALVPEEDRAAVVDAVSAALKGPISRYSIEHRVKAARSETIWISSEGRVVARDAQGRALRMLGTNRDVSERVRGDQALRESEARFKGAFENSATGMSLIALDGRWMKVNRAVCEITGYSEAELLERSFQDITHPEDLALGATGLAELLSGERETAQIEKRYLHKSGRIVWVLVNLSLVRDQDGTPRHFISQTLDVSERRELLQRVEHLALHDPLTGLPNARLLQDRVEHAISIARRSQRAMGIMYVDLDEFKPVNDTLGHAAGDQVLQEFAARLRKSLRETDSVARVGGDEFVVVLGEVGDEAHAAAAAERVMAAVAVPFALENAQARLSASIGIALYPLHGGDTQTLLKNADAAMYEAKRAGKNSYRFFAGDAK